MTEEKKDLIDVLLKIPLVRQKIILIAISNSPKHCEEVRKCYEKIPNYLYEVICFEPYTAEEFELIVGKKIDEEYDPMGVSEKLNKLMVPNALKHICAKFALQSGDIRILFDALRICFSDSNKKHNCKPVLLEDVVKLINDKLKPKAVKIITELTSEQKLALLAFYCIMVESGKNTFTYKASLSKLNGNLNYINYRHQKRIESGSNQLS